MAWLDNETGEVVVRIVYDGIPEAGKTTNLQHLTNLVPLQRRGQLASPASVDRSTAFFDWLDFAGGFLDGARLRCQLLTVPGQPSRLHRRLHLLNTADAVVFVADSRRACVEANRACWQALTEALRRGARGEVPARVVLQANKQDAPDALSPLELAEALGAAADVSLVAARTGVGIGVMQTFVMGVRAATERAQHVVRGGGLEAADEAALNAEALYAKLLSLEPAAAPPAPPSPTTAVGEALVTAGLAPARDVDAPAVPNAAEIPAHFIWPAAHGRAALSQVNAATLRWRSAAWPWAPGRALEVDAGPWVVHTTPLWCFTSQEEARAAYISLVRATVAQGALAPPGRTFVLSDSDGIHRVLMLTPKGGTLGEELEAALHSDELARVVDAIGRARTAEQALPPQVRPSLDAVGHRDGRWVVLGHGEGAGAASLSEQVRERLAHHRARLLRGARFAGVDES